MATRPVEVSVSSGKVVQRSAFAGLGRKLIPYGMLFPAVALLILLNLIASGFGVYLSFLDWNYFRPNQLFDWVGLRHYAALVTDPIFLTAVEHTVVWSAVVVPGGFLVGLYLALLLNEDVRGKWLFRTLILLPWAVPLVVAAVTWSFFFSPGNGPLNDALFKLGQYNLKYMNWLGSETFAFPIVMGVQIWRTAPFFAITLLAGLQSIPPDLYDAAEIDGADSVGRFRFITLPLLRPVAAVVLLQGLIWSFFNFTTVFVMTQGGPAHASELLTIYLWRQAFPLADVGSGSAVGTILVLFLSIVGTFWVIGVMRKETTG
ncbi:MAG: sugar ABC transporter permease [Ardenticatenaceae bacterium]|nr:sugar ABC transporter permease [Ardenticatenaceae bacterium]HBY93807.1 hypothetical protein [Chloroflexota bacterium]